MDKETLKKAETLNNKLEYLVDNKKKLVASVAMWFIAAEIKEDTYIKGDRIDTKYLNFDNIKTFLLEEIDKEIAKTQKEFDELWNRQ